MEKYNIYFESSEDMSKIPSESIRLMITSPPYWDLKDYEVDNQIGYKEDYKKYLGRLLSVWKETYRVLKKDGVAIININTKSFNQKLVLIPFDFIKQMKSIGFLFKDIHYWHKSSGIPRPDNLADHFEYFLIFSKSENLQINPFDFFDYKLKKKFDKVNIWNINKKFGSVGKKYMVHLAIFPVEYITRMIEIFTKEEDYILEPFLGSGTTLISAMKTNRNCVCYELNKEGYFPMIKDRLRDLGLNENTINFI